MDCKSVDDLEILSRESIIKEYVILSGCYIDLKSSENRQLQEIHQLKRELSTASNDKQHLSSELEIINVEHAKEIEAINRKHQEEVQEYKERLLALKNELESVESDRDNVEVMLENIRKEGVEEKVILPTVPVDSNHSSITEKIVELEMENDELANALDGLKVELTEALKMNVQLENKIEDLTDRLHCAEENLEAKRSELEEKTEMYETVQERVIELSGELNAIRMESDTAAKRGNSLFAEVDDQRQKMRAILVAQKANYIEMKNELEKYQQEVRKLKRENTAMYKEIEVCSHLFLNAEQHHTEKLNERIAELMKENEAINKKLAFTEGCLSESIKKNDSKWLDPMIALCKNESNDLKDKLYRCSLEKVTIAGTLRQREEELARWRFEALKSRCIVADRESLLEDHKIPFGAISNIQSRVMKIDNENLSPNIACRPSMLGYKRRSMNKRQSMNVVAKSPVEDVEKAFKCDAESMTNSADTVTVKFETDTNVTAPSEPTIVNEIDNNNVFKRPIGCDTKPTAATVKPELITPSKIKIKEKLVPQSTNFSGVTMRKKLNESATVSEKKISTPGISSRSAIRPKMTAPKISAGILQPSSNVNVQSERKVKFGDRSSVAKKNIERPGHIVEKPSSEQKVDKVDAAPKTAIKKRIFIPSTKKATK